MFLKKWCCRAGEVPSRAAAARLEDERVADDPHWREFPCAATSLLRDEVVERLRPAATALAVRAPLGDLRRRIDGFDPHLTRGVPVKLSTPADAAAPIELTNADVHDVLLRLRHRSATLATITNTIA